MIIRQIIQVVLAGSLICTLVKDNMDLRLLERQMQSVCSEIASLQAERVAARRVNQKEVLGMRQDLNKLDVLSKDAGRFPHWPEDKQ